MFFEGARFTIAGVLASLLALSGACRDAASHTRHPSAPVVGFFTERHAESVAETRRILFGAGDRSFLLEGWSVDERESDLDQTFVWATANEASVSFMVLDVIDEQFLVTLRAYPTPEPQTITVFVNGHEASRFTSRSSSISVRRSCGMARPRSESPDVLSFDAWAASRGPRSSTSSRGLQLDPYRATVLAIARIWSAGSAGRSASAQGARSCRNGPGVTPTALSRA
jgi:hypothetical protein